MQSTALSRYPILLKKFGPFFSQVFLISLMIALVIEKIEVNRMRTYVTLFSMSTF